MGLKQSYQTHEHTGNCRCCKDLLNDNIGPREELYKKTILNLKKENITQCSIDSNCRNNLHEIVAVCYNGENMYTARFSHKEILNSSLLSSFIKDENRDHFK
jgi:hypothetical protein